MKIPTQENIEYVKEWLELKLTTGKASNLLVNQLAQGLINRTLHFHIVCDEIGVLEGALYSRSSNTKPASEFRHQPLQGLWHKHYTEPSHILENIKNHWGRDFKRFTFIEDEILAGQEAVQLTPAILGQIAQALVMNAHHDRNESQKMTGEWIVYAVHNEENYYLTIGTHKEGDEEIATRIRECAAEFPDLNLRNHI